MTNHVSQETEIYDCARADTENVDYDDRSGARCILPKTCILCVNEFMNMGGVLGYCGISGLHHILNNS